MKIEKLQKENKSYDEQIKQLKNKIKESKEKAK